MKFYKKKKGLYGRRCSRSPVGWYEVGENSLNRTQIGIGCSGEGKINMGEVEGSPKSLEVLFGSKQKGTRTQC